MVLKWNLVLEGLCKGRCLPNVLCAIFIKNKHVHLLSLLRRAILFPICFINMEDQGSREQRGAWVLCLLPPTSVWLALIQEAIDCAF